MRRDPARRPTARRITVSALAVVGLTLPLAACSTGEANGVGIVRAGCPTEIRIQTDDLPRIEWGFLYSLLDEDKIRVRADSVSAPLLVDGDDSGATLTILIGDPDDGKSANAELYDDEDLFLAAVDTDAAILDFGRHPTVGIFAPLLRNPRIGYWDTAVYPEVDGIPRFNGRFVPDGSELVPVVTPPGDPFGPYAVGKRMLAAEQLSSDIAPTIQGFVEAGRLSVHSGDALVDPYLLAGELGEEERVRSRLVEDIGYRSDPSVLSARPQTIVRYSDCLEVLVPVFQQALVDFLDEPEDTTQLIVDLSAQFGDDSYDLTLAAVAFAVLESEDFVGNGSNGTIGDLEIGRVRALFDDAIPAWQLAEVRVPRGVELDAIVSNRFIDRSIGL